MQIAGDIFDECPCQFGADCYGRPRVSAGQVLLFGSGSSPLCVLPSGTRSLRRYRPPGAHTVPALPAITAPSLLWGESRPGAKAPLVGLPRTR